MIACLLYEYSGSLYPGVALHCLIDAATFEAAITGNDHVVFLVFVTLGAIVLLYAAVETSADGSTRAAGQHRVGASPSWSKGRPRRTPEFRLLRNSRPLPGSRLSGRRGVIGVQATPADRSSTVLGCTRWGQ